MGVFYPSCIVNFRLRFDEAFSITEQPEATSTSSQVTKGTTQHTLSASPSVLSQPIKIGLVQEDNLSKVANRMPKTAEVELPAYRQAGTFSMTFDYRDLPIDPRLIRACGVEVHMGVVNPDDFSTGMMRSESDGSRKSILRTTDEAGLPRAETLLLVGVVDTWSVSHSSKSSEISIQGRDVRGILLDSPIDPKTFKNLDLTKPIDEVVRNILAKHPFGERIKVETNEDDWREPGTQGPILLPSPVSSDGITRVNQGTSGKGAESKPAGNVDQINFWDLITRYCFLVGAIPYFTGQKLRIRPSRSIFDQQKAGSDPRIKTPFANGQKRRSPGDPGGEEFGIRKLVYGREIADMTFERKYTGVKSRIIECISIDTSSGERGKQKLISARWPENTPKTTPAGKAIKTKVTAKVGKAKQTSVAPSGSATQEEVLRIPVPGINNKDKLREIAKNLFEEIGRGEMGGSVTTKSLASFLVPDDPQDKLAGNRDPDLVRIRPGDAVELTIDTRELSAIAPLVSSYVDTVRRPFEDEVADLRQRLGQTGEGSGGEDLARVLVASARGGIVELAKFFRVANVKFSWNKDSGIGLSFDYQNYVEVRSGVTPSSGANILPPTVKES